jgi:hypothetical protein
MTAAVNSASTFSASTFRLNRQQTAVKTGLLSPAPRRPPETQCLQPFRPLRDISAKVITIEQAFDFLLGNT